MVLLRGGSCLLHYACESLQHLLGDPQRPSTFTPGCTAPHNSMLWFSHLNLPEADFRTSGQRMSCSPPTHQAPKCEMRRPWNFLASCINSNTALLDYSFRYIWTNCSLSKPHLVLACWQPHALASMGTTFDSVEAVQSGPHTTVPWLPRCHLPA